MNSAFSLVNSPCVVAFLRLYVLPRVVLGPVDFFAFARLAASKRSETVPT